MQSRSWASRRCTVSHGASLDPRAVLSAKHAGDGRRACRAEGSRLPLHRIPEMIGDKTQDQRLGGRPGEGTSTGQPSPRFRGRPGGGQSPAGCGLAAIGRRRSRKSQSARPSSPGGPSVRARSARPLFRSEACSTRVCALRAAMQALECRRGGPTARDAAGEGTPAGACRIFMPRPRAIEAVDPARFRGVPV